MNVDRDYSLAPSARTPFRKKPLSHEEKKISTKTKFNILRAVMPEEKAVEILDIDKTNLARMRSNDDEVAVIRDKLQKLAGITIEDQAKWYMGIRNDADSATVSERISAAKQIDTILGYNAPQKIDISERRELSAAISVVSNLGVNPMELKKLLNDRRNMLNVSTQ